MELVNKPFKKPGWRSLKKTRNLKQILTQEKSKELKTTAPTCTCDLCGQKHRVLIRVQELICGHIWDPSLTDWNIEALPSMTPQKKYCDITGLEVR